MASEPILITFNASPLGLGTPRQVNVQSTAADGTIVHVEASQSSGASTGVTVASGTLVDNKCSIPIPIEGSNFYRLRGDDGNGASVSLGTLNAWCTGPEPGASAASLLEGGNSFGAPYIFGSNDAQPVSGLANAIEFMHVLAASQRVGFGTATPGTRVDIKDIVQQLVLRVRGEQATGTGVRLQVLNEDPGGSLQAELDLGGAWQLVNDPDGGGDEQFSLEGPGQRYIFIDNATGIMVIACDVDANSALQVKAAGGLQLRPTVSGVSTTPLRFYEVVASGSNYVSIKAPDTLAASVNYTWPTADGSIGQALVTDGSGIWSWVSLVKARFSAAASLVNAAAQFVPQSGLATSLTLNYGAMQPTVGTLSALYVQFTGDAANVAGQTIVGTLLKNGVAVTGAVTAAMATTAGIKSANVSFTAVALSPGDVLTLTLTPSAALTAVVTIISAAVQ